ncbi:hypothetical protein ES703_88599 [subsurface metagenome]
MLRKKNINRRQFLRKASQITTGAIVFPYVVPSSVLGKAGHVAPSNRITVGCIGVGPQGARVMRNFLRSDDAQVVAICDVKTTRIELVQKLVDDYYQNHDCATYNDFRELLIRDDIDARAGCTGGGEGGQGHVRGEAAGIKRGTGSGFAGDDSSLRASVSVRHPAAVKPKLSLCLRTGTQRTNRQAAHH